MKTIVISAVNLVEAGTLAILKDCLANLSEFTREKGFRIVAIVHNKELIDLPNIEYIEDTWPKKRWINRLWFEYQSMKKISKDLGSIYLWFSLHDTSPNVFAERRAVYCHNSFSFYKWKLHDLIFAPKIAMFAIFTKYIYKTNIKKNDYLVVQQNWFREAMAKMFNFPKEQIIVAPPQNKFSNTYQYEVKQPINKSPFTFIYAASANSHKNFEIICEASALIERKYPELKFQVILTLNGQENKYAKWVYKKWSDVDSINFRGFVSRQTLQELYETSDCLIYPSKVESWGLPISEYAALKKPMLLADLAYAKETASGSQETAFFNPESPNELAQLMQEIILNNKKQFHSVPNQIVADPVANSWADLFKILLK